MTNRALRSMVVKRVKLYLQESRYKSSYYSGGMNYLTGDDQTAAAVDCVSQSTSNLINLMTLLKGDIEESIR